MGKKSSINYQIFINQTLLESLARDLVSEKGPSREDLIFLSQALTRIARGEDPAAVFGIKAAKGKRTSYAERLKIAKLQTALGWITTATAPNDPNDQYSGLGLTLEVACADAAELFPGHSEETLRNEWNNRPSMRRQSFGMFQSPSPETYSD